MATILRSEEAIYVVMDVGTSKVTALVAHPDSEGRLRVIGVGTVPSVGMRKGGVVSLEGVAHAVEAAKDKAERTSGYEITSALVSISGAQMASQNSKGMAGVSGRTIGRDDVERALEAARSLALPYNRNIVHVIPRGFVVDGQDGIKSPIGMHGYRLEIEAHVVTAGETALRNLEKCVEAGGLAVDGWVLASLASGEAVLTDTEREMGVVVCDIGGGTCDMAVYIEGAVWHTAVIPVGGDHMTNDIALCMHLPQETAEAVKRQHGHAQVAGVDGQQTFAVRPFGDRELVQIGRADLAAVLEPRVEELFGFVRQEIKRSGYDGLLPAGAVLTGGTSLIAGIPEVASSVLGLPVRLGKPEDLRGLVEHLSSPAFSTGVGLLRWAHRQEAQRSSEDRRHARTIWTGANLRRAASGILRRLLPG
ncbi:MAG: cell division protein FtsA [Anaerolineales bacterium]|jgi:cell division protein FtsA